MTRLRLKAATEEIASSLNLTLGQIERQGETPTLKAEMLFKYARLKFSEGKYKESHNLLGQCNTVLIDNNLPENDELYYWTGRIYQQWGNLEKMKLAFTAALNVARFKNDQEFIDDILERIL